MEMNVSRRLSEAIGSWLHVEFCCYRAGLFSESSLKVAVGQVLSSFPIERKGERVHADFPHDLLNPKSKSGRKRELDFALVLAGDGVSKRNALIAVETKWAGSSHCKPKKIFQDFLRLAAIKRGDPKTVCIFILAGRHEEIGAVLKGMPFTSSGKKNNSGIGSSGKQKRMTPDSANIEHREYFSIPIRSLTDAGIILPASFMCQSHGLHPLQTQLGTVDFQAIAWEIKSVSDECINAALW